MLYIFDWDGTLCNSLHKIVNCTRAAAADVGLPLPTEAAVRDIIGLSLPRAIEKIFPGIAEQDYRELLKAYSARFSSERAQVTDFYPFARETLEHLLAEGHYLAVATGKSRRGLDRVLQEMEVADLFHGTRCADETESKPSPRMLQELLQEFSLDATRAVMIGDTEYDMAMARDIAMPRIAVSYGAHTVDRLLPYQPTLCIDSMMELRDWVYQPEANNTGNGAGHCPG